MPRRREQVECYYGRITIFKTESDSISLTVSEDEGDSSTIHLNIDMLGNLIKTLKDLKEVNHATTTETFHLQD